MTQDGNEQASQADVALSLIPVILSQLDETVLITAIAHGLQDHGEHAARGLRDGRQAQIKDSVLYKREPVE